MTSDFLKSDKNTEYMSDSQRYASPFTFGNIKNFGYTYGRQHPARMVNLAGNRALNKYDLSRNMSVRSVRSNDTIFDDRAFISKSLRKKYISDKAKKLKT